MRLLLLTLLMLAWAIPGLAAQTFSLPITIIPGSAILDPDNVLPFPVSIPFSEFFQYPAPCSGTQGTASAGTCQRY